MNSLLVTEYPSISVLPLQLLPFEDGISHLIHAISPEGQDRFLPGTSLPRARPAFHRMRRHPNARAERESKPPPERGMGVARYQKRHADQSQT